MKLISNNLHKFLLQYINDGSLVQDQFSQLVAEGNIFHLLQQHFPKKERENI